MEFSERTQAFLVATYYDLLTKAFGKRGEKAYIQAVKHYAMQRGGRMAQRAIRDGRELDYAAFCCYGEWAPSQEALNAGIACVMKVKSTMPDFVYHISPCAWHQAFVELNASEAGKLYCRYLDEAINQGFNGAIRFHTVQTKHWAEECVFCVKDAGFTPQTQIQRHPEYVKGFDYHCAHTYYSFGEVVRGVFGREAADEICRQVLEAFEKKYGSDMRGQLTSYVNENFNCA